VEGEAEGEEEEEADHAEYEKRLEQVLALAPDSPPTVPTSRARLTQFDEGDDEWTDYHPINVSYDDAVREVLGEDGTEKGEDEFGAQVSDSRWDEADDSRTTRRQHRA
jgi:hypothetical protein